MIPTANLFRIAVFLMACYFKVTLIFCCAWAAAAFLRRRQAALRHGLWAAAILGALAIPVLSAMVPTWPSKSLEMAMARLTPIGVTHSNATSRAIPGTVINAISEGRVVHQWPAILAFVLGGGSLLVLGRLGVNLIRVALLSARSKPLSDDGWLHDLQRLSQELRVPRSVRLLGSSSSTPPITWGVLNHEILLPASAVEWGEDRRRVVLHHELSHIVRHDSLLQVLGEIARALYWCHPLAWLAANRLRHESECACDDSVLNSGIHPCCYADHLLALARTFYDRRHCSPALAMARSTRLERRFMAILNSAADRRVLSRKAKVLVPVLTLCLLLPLAALRLPAQNESGKFTGTVYDPSGAAIPNATIIMIDHQTNTRDMTTSDAVGNFQFARLPAGDYEFEVMKAGFKTFTVPSVTLQAGGDSSLNANLDIGSVEDSVRVTSQRPANATGQASPVGSTENPKRIRIGGAVEAAHLFTQVMPVYPQAAKDAGAQGTVVLHAVVAKDGSLLSLRVMNGQVNPDLARAAVEAVSHWRYRPTLLNGEPVEVDTTIEVHFTLSS